MTVEEVRGSLDLTDNGAIKNSIRNCLTVFQNDPVLQGAVRYNILTERIDIVKPLWWSKQTATLTDTDLNYLMLYLEDKYSLTSEKKIQKALSIIADSNKYHPIRDYLNGLEWDGTERIRYALPRFLGAEEGEYTYQALRLFMLGAISRVFKPGCKFEVMLCLVGGQGAGKSTFFRLLAVKDEWFSDDLKKIDDDNVYRKMQGHWIIEMSEMIATANAKSIEDIKSFISRAKETYKVPYETHPADRLRQCVFGGSSNTMDFLPLDRSGNRRFLPIMVHPENAEISMVFQRVYLFQDTIYNNISMGKPDATEEEVYEAAKKARCYDFIMALPDGFQTIIGEGGATLSGGEKQRISIARCILKDAPIVILDEATASVDTDNESYIQEAISELVKGKTLLVIAHRLNTIQNADQILVIDNGQIAQQGTHEELLKQPGIYQEFVNIRKNAAGWSLA